MCEECRQTPCDSQCPNAPEPPAVFICDGCGEEIREGDDAWHVLYEVYCENCIDSFRSTAEYIGDY